jgi:hypothetical protein
MSVDLKITVTYPEIRLARFNESMEALVLRPPFRLSSLRGSVITF